jgi:hypothetical protein
MDHDIRVLSLAALAAALLSTVAAAQAPPKDNPPIPSKTEKLDPNACGHDRATVGSGGELDTKKDDGRNLSERLAQSHGVICPPSPVDPAIQVPTPPGGTMPVIPPPGSPGGDLNVQPK